MEQRRDFGINKDTATILAIDTRSHCLHSSRPS